MPDSDAAAAGDAALATLSATAESVVVWFRAVGIRPGDTGQLTLRMPDGTVVASDTITFDQTKAVMFRAVGVRNSQSRFPDGLPLGAWTGQAVLKRDGRVTGERTVKATVAATN